MYILKASFKDFLKASNLLSVKYLLGKMIDKPIFIPAEAEKTYAPNSKNNVPIATIINKIENKLKLSNVLTNVS
ncbi:MAG: hypothetical protein QXX78_00725 [Nitrososphaerota archaeon]